MKLFTWSWLLGVLSYVLLGVLRRSGSADAGIFPGVPGVVTLFLLFLLAGTGAVLGVLSLNRKEVKTWWGVSTLVLNLVVLAGILLLFAG